MSAPGRYTYADFNAPLSSRRADAIADALARDDPRTVLDICGWGELGSADLADRNVRGRSASRRSCEERTQVVPRTALV